MTSLAGMTRRLNSLCNQASMARSQLFAGIASGDNVDEVESQLSMLQAESDSVLAEIQAEIVHLRDELKATDKNPGRLQI